MKRTILLLLSLTVIMIAQNKLLTPDDFIMNARDLAPKKLKSLQWKNNSSFTYIKSIDKKQVLVEQEYNSDEATPVVSLAEFKEQASKADLAFKSFPRYKWEGDNLTFWKKSVKYSYSPNDKSFTKVFELPEKAENKEFSSDGKLIAYTVENNLFFTDAENNETQITKDEDKAIVNGQTVHRNEFAIEKGIFWSPDSKYIAFYRKDESMVTDYPMLNISTTPATVDYVKYPMAGGKSHHVTLGVYNVSNGNTLFLKTGEPLEQYLTAVTWDPDSEHIYVGLLNRDQNHLKMIKYSAITGNPVETVFEETNDKYVEPEHDLIFLPGDYNKFLWLSERDGFLHFHMYNTNGEYEKQLTKGEWLVMEFYGIDDEFVYFSATKESPIEEHIYKVSLNDSKVTKLTTEKGVHNAKFTKDFSKYIDTYTSLEVPSVQQVVETESLEKQTICTSPDPLANYTKADVKIFTIKNNENTDLYCRLILPTDFDENKKYPTIVYVYGGPHAQLVTESYPYGRYQMWFQTMAQKGYIIFTVDNRGSANRGRDFEQAVHRKLGKKEIEDQMAGVEYLKSLPYVDSERMGVFGWSFGGFMTTSMMLKTNDTFKVGVAGGAVIDWNLYEIMYTERYMDTPEQNPEGYEEANLLNHVDKLNGRLLLVHGTSDPVVVWQQTLRFAEKAMKENKPLDYYPYQAYPHHVSGADARHLWNKITQYFVDFL